VGTALAIALVAQSVHARAASTCDPDATFRTRAEVVRGAAACYDAHRLADTAAIYRRRLAGAPADRALRTELARVLMEAGELAAAEGEYDRLLASPYEGDMRIRKARADVIAWQGRPTEAIAEYRTVVAAEPANASAQLGLGRVLGWEGRPGEAETALRAAVAADPANADAQRELAALLASPAHRAWRAEEARLAAPHDPDRWAEAIDALILAQDLGKATTLVDEGARRWPEDRRFVSFRETVRRALADDVARRLAAARARTAADPADRRARLELASVLAEGGDFAAAQAEYERCVAEDAKDPKASRELARVLSWRGDYGRSLALYDALIADAPDDRELLRERANVLSWDGQLNEAAAGFRRLTSDAGAVRGLADVHRWSEQYAAAAHEYETVRRLAPESEHAQVADAYLTAERSAVAVAPWFSFFDDSDGFRAFHGGVEGTRRFGLTTDLSASFSHDDYDQHRDHLAAERIHFSLRHDLGVAWRATLHYGPSIYDDGRVTHGYGATVARFFEPESTAAIGYDHYDIIDEVGSIRTATDRIIQADRVRLSGHHVLPWRIELGGTAGWAAYTDGNALTTASLSVSRRVLRVPRVVLGYSFNFVSYAERTDLYWDPRHYVSNGAVASLSQPVGPRVRIVLDGRVGYGVDRDGSLERAGGARVEFGEFSFGTFRTLSADVGYQYAESGELGIAGGNYSAHSGRLSIRYRFSGP
jgi:tetratricopeptide (TPR) repeat protein